jgi:hypothetical protein
VVEGAVSQRQDGRWGQLRSPDTATTVVIERDPRLLLDRPLMETKEVIEGLGILDEADVEEALTIVRTNADARRQGRGATSHRP